MRQQFIFAAVAVLIAVLFTVPSISLYFRSLLSIRLSSASVSENELATQNEALRAELTQLQYLKNELPAPPGGYQTAIVFSGYPFNFKNELTVNAGRKNGIEISEPVVISSKAESPDLGILIGRIKSVYDNVATVQTVFDSKWSHAVRIGAAGVDGLMVGGIEPSVSFIAKDAKISAGDAIYSSDENFPYGMPIATVRSVETTRDGTFQTAKLSFIHDLGKIKTVFILKYHGRTSDK